MQHSTTFPSVRSLASRTLVATGLPLIPSSPFRRTPHPISQISPILLVLTLVALLGVPWSHPIIPPAPIPPTPPVGFSIPPETIRSIGQLPLPLQYAISRDTAADDPAYQIAPADDGYRAANAAQRLVATFGPAGLHIAADDADWRVVLESWGRDGSLAAAIPSGAPQAQANRLTVPYRGLSAWYVNGPLGVQQGWTIPARPAGAAPLRLRLQTSGALQALREPDGRGLALRDAAGAARLHYGGLLAYDATGQTIPAAFSGAGPAFELVVDDQAASYPLTIDPLVQVAKLTAADGADNDYLGHSVAMSGDGSTVVAGAPYNAAGGIQRGAAYVYVKPDGGWASTTQIAKLTAADGADNDRLGVSVVVSGDGSTVVAGAYQNAAGGIQRGAAYVYVKPGGGWVSATQIARLTAADGADNDLLGTSVAVSSDGSTIVAGAYLNAVGGIAHGAAYVYVKPGGGWVSATQTAKLTASDGIDFDWLGLSVAVSGDGSTVVVGAPENAAGGIARGAAYVYVQPGGGWANATQTAKLTASDRADNDWLGCSVAVSGDGSIVVAGADQNAAGGIARGAAYVYVRPGGGWANATQTAKLTASDGADNDRLGWSVAVSGDGSTVVAGVYYNAAGGIARGAAYVYVRPSGGWVSATQSAKLTASDGADLDHLGNSVAVNGNGSTVVAGAPWNAAGGVQHGAAYLFQKPTLTIAAAGTLSRVPSNATFVITRDLPTGDLVVPFTLGGTAVFGTDYRLTNSSVVRSRNNVSGWLTIPDGTSTFTLTVAPFAGRPSGQTVQFTLQPDTAYVLGTPASASLSILPTVTVTASGSPSRFGPKNTAIPGYFRVARGADTSGNLTVTFALTGTAVVNTAYDLNGAQLVGANWQVIIPDGTRAVTATLKPLVDAQLADTAFMSLTPASTYAIGQPNSAGLTIDGTPPPNWLVLLYLAGDDVDPTSHDLSLTDSLKPLLNRLPANPNMRLLALYDGNQDGDSRLYLREPNGLRDVTETALNSPQWLGSVGGSTGQREFDTGNVATLENFIRWARSTYPGSPHTMLSIVDHGGGWAPDLNSTAQPGGKHRVQAGGLRGMSIDQGSGHSLSTRNTGQALADLGGLGQFDLVFFDACLMGMIESADEVQPYTHYLVAGENLLWSRLPYERYLSNDAIGAQTTPRELAQMIVSRYNDPAPPDEPFTIAALDMQKLPALAQHVGALADALASNLPAARDAYTASQKFDYNASYTIDTTDGYVDLGDFAAHITIPGAATTEAQAVIGALGDPQTGTGVVVARKTVSGSSREGGSWDLAHASGLSIYLPLGELDCRPTGLVSTIPAADAPCPVPDQSLGARVTFQLTYYVDPAQLAFTRDVPQWAALLHSLLDAPTVAGLTSGSYGLPLPSASAWYVFLPTVRR